jgi:hypothetical protein
MSAVSCNIQKALQKINFEILREMQDLHYVSLHLDMRSDVRHTADVFDTYLNNTTFLNGLTHLCTLEIDSRDGRQGSSRCYSNSLSAGIQALLVQGIADTGFYTIFRGGTGDCIPVRASFSTPV